MTNSYGQHNLEWDYGLDYCFSCAELLIIVAKVICNAKNKYIQFDIFLSILN